MTPARSSHVSAPRHHGGGLPPESPIARARRAQEIVRRLDRRYPHVKIPLRHRSPLELLISTILSAQSTDEQVNKVTPALFRRYRTAADFAGARRQDLEAMIHSTGFYHTKARAIQNASRMLLERYGGEVPRTMEELVRLDGVGRKTANVVLSAFGVPGIVVDTHVRRLSRRMALTAHDDPDKIEQDLMLLVPRDEWSDFSLRLIYFGREICTARRPGCPACPLRDLCPSGRYAGSPPWMRPPRAHRLRGAAVRAGRPRGRRVRGPVPG
ncbi:MAG TPA: endonuclease III [bacterium]|nr:endonuclease III [bacterium]